MATNTGACTVQGQRHYSHDAATYSEAGWSNYGTDDAYAGKTYTSQQGARYFPVILKFTTPAFAGVSERITINYSAMKGFGQDPILLRWALCTSDAKKKNYWGVTGDVEDTYQIASGKVTHEGIGDDFKTWSVSVDIKTLAPNTTYYFYLWGGDATTGSSCICVNTPDYHSVTIEWNSGLVRIYNGSSWDTYQCYVYNGSSWDLYLPYIYNGSSWDLYSG